MWSLAFVYTEPSCAVGHRIVADEVVGTITALSSKGYTRFPGYGGIVEVLPAAIATQCAVDVLCTALVPHFL
jgi:hypothetical protein